MKYQRTSPLFKQQCAAMAKHSGEQCRRPVKAGDRHCRMHGGNAPTSLAAARKRLEHLRDPAITAVEEALALPVLEARDYKIKLQAARIVLDRTGFAPGVRISLDQSEPLLDYTKLSDEELHEHLEELTAWSRRLLKANRQDEEIIAMEPAKEEAHESSE